MLLIFEYFVNTNSHKLLVYKHIFYKVVWTDRILLKRVKYVVFLYANAQYSNIQFIYE